MTLDISTPEQAMKFLMKVSPWREVNKSWADEIRCAIIKDNIDPIDTSDGFHGWQERYTIDGFEYSVEGIYGDDSCDTVHVKCRPDGLPNCAQHAQVTCFTDDQWYQFKSTIRQLSNSKELTAIDMVWYNVINCRPINCGFNPVTNQAKVNTGQLTHQYRNIGRLANTARLTTEQQFNDRYGDGHFSTQTMTSLRRAVTRSLNRHRLHNIIK